MNYVKVTAKSPFINLSLFVLEAQIGKKLKEIQELHSKTDPFMVNEYAQYNIGLENWVNKNVLSVTMRRVIIDLKKHRGLKERLSGLDHVPSFTQLQIAA